MKKVLLILVFVLMISFPVGVLAAGADVSVADNMRGFMGISGNSDELTDQQKADLDESFDQMMEIREDSIHKMIENGLLTEEQGNLALERLEEMEEHHEEYGYSYGMMGGSGRGGFMTGARGLGCGFYNGD